MTDKRRSPRQKTYKIARIGSNGRASLTCLVHNLSDTGACLCMPAATGVPDQFNLVFDTGEPARVCQVIWRRNRKVGVAFQ